MSHISPTMDTLRALGAGAGNSPTEILVPILERMGMPTDADTRAAPAAADEVLKPFIESLP
ncbi:hypothetical protein [Streptomyces sp. NPDC005181]|uniref:hypothetical protein n=1 Tax=Streptomyces sp. NPDC005181 TaxID=3156869 RepID=UPI0033ACB004